MYKPLTSGFLICVSIRWLRSTRSRRPNPSWLRQDRVRADWPGQSEGGARGSGFQVLPPLSHMHEEGDRHLWCVPPPGPGQGGSTTSARRNFNFPISGATFYG
ncbi:hypothetical protein GCM10010363_63300 [Streptomyces omiyaensis]|nr:hypothetical protein GCM10010363_63300 [Streptomyces omiyaensis]